MTPELKAFLQAYADWAYGDDDHNPYGFDQRFGLCYNALPYTHNIVNIDVNTFELRRELEWMFVADGLDITYPFGQDDFNNSDDLRTCPKRRAWVLSKLESAT